MHNTIHEVKSSSKNTFNVVKTYFYQFCAPAICLFLILGSVTAWAEASEETDESEASSETIAEFVESIGHTAREIEIVPVGALYSVETSTGDVFYVSEDRNYIFDGNIYRFSDQGLINVTASRKNKIRRNLLSKLDMDETLNFGPDGETKAIVHVFTDVDCGYCRLLHQHIPEYNKAGIEIRYLAYPRAGLESETYRRMVSAWCSDDRNAAMTLLKNGQNIRRERCENPVETHFALGRQLGISGTPALVLPDGSLVPGYQDPQQLAARINL